MVSGGNGPQEDENRGERLSDEQLLDLVQESTFQYFWDGAEPVSGLSCERIHLDDVYPSNDRDVVTSGGTGFGLMAILVAIEREFVTREEAVLRLSKMMESLKKADRFHGVWPHWLHGPTGKVKPFSRKDDGGDLVETSFLAQGLICVRQYFRNGNAAERKLASEADELWRDIEWDWHRGPSRENVLYWHWSPKHQWEMDFRIRGYNECLITYVLAASSPTHGVPAEVYHEGWAERGQIRKTTASHGVTLQLKHQGIKSQCAPLFWAHYSFLGLDPRGLSDRYGNYWQHNQAHVQMCLNYCIENPAGHKGYSKSCWGLTSSYSPKGYRGHCPQRDEGTIAPTAALSSFPYNPVACMAALRYFHDELGDRLLGKYGFYDAFNQSENWFPTRYLAIDQGPIVIMIEDHRSGLLWNLFMSAPEVQAGLEKLNFVTTRR
ncbi:MAG: glucoamylase family protein [Planctomycetaceae bacterium]